MRKLITILLLALPALAGSVEDVRDAEIAFAKAFTDRDQAKFFSCVLDDATFFGGLSSLHGKSEVVARWSRFFSGPEAPFNWTPERVAVNAAGNIGLSSGPVFDAKGTMIGVYGSVWIKQPNGSWKILFDGPGGPAACLADNAAPIKDGDITLSDGAKLHYKVAGDGPIKMIIPGLLLEKDFKQLGDLATIYFYDPRNRGIQQDVKDLETVRDYFKIDKFVPVGSSDAGLLVAMYAAEHPERVSRIVELWPAPPADSSALNFAKITMPVLTIRGREWAMTLPDARMVTIERGDHVNVFAAIRQFLRNEWPLRAEKVN